MVELIVDSFEGKDENNNATHCIGSVLNDEGLKLRCVIPWLLRGKSGNIEKGTRIVAERFQDGSGLVVGLKSGIWGEVIYGSEIKLGSDSATDFVALAKKVSDNLDLINDAVKKIATHTHPVSGTAAGESTDLETYKTGIIFGSMASQNVKAK